jgi:hypothetical protein
LNPKRTAIIIVAVLAILAWFSAAMTPPSSPIAPRRIAPAPVDASGAALASEIERLRERLRPQPAPRVRVRNPFSFDSSSRQTPVAAAAPLAEDGDGQTPGGEAAPWSLSLSGIAEDPGPDGPVRTAIIAGPSQLFLVKEGGTITERGVTFVVERIATDMIELRDPRDGTLRQLSFR